VASLRKLPIKDSVVASAGSAQTASAPRQRTAHTAGTQDPLPRPSPETPLLATSRNLRSKSRSQRKAHRNMQASAPSVMRSMDTSLGIGFSISGIASPASAGEQRSPRSEGLRRTPLCHIRSRILFKSSSNLAQFQINETKPLNQKYLAKTAPL